MSEMKLIMESWENFVTETAAGRRSRSRNDVAQA